MATTKFLETPLTKEVNFRQRTSDGFIGVRSIFALVNKMREEEGKETKRFDDYLKRKETQEILQELLKMNKIKELELSRESSEQLKARDIKELGLYQNSRGAHGDMWLHPILAIDVVGWLHPKIKVMFNTIVFQQLFKKRIDISDAHNLLMETIVEHLGKPTSSFFYVNLATFINVRMFGSHEPGIRDSATDEQYKLMLALFGEITTLVKFGMLKTFTSILKHIDSNYTNMNERMHELFK